MNNSVSIQSVPHAKEAEFHAQILGGLVSLFVALVCGLILLDRVDLLIFAFPGAATAVGFWLYATSPSLYVGFTFSIWFVTPLIRRIVDYMMGSFDPTNFIMTTPILVTLISAFAIFSRGQLLTRARSRPMLFALCGIIPGYFVGVVLADPVAATYSFLQWIAPVFLAFHVATSWSKYPRYLSVIRSTLSWGLLLMGSYGLIQYFLAPPWDMMWLRESNMWISMGQPEATQFRVFSTLNSTGPFAFVITACLLFLADGRDTVAKLGLVPGYLTFLLSLVRSAWAGWTAGVLYLIWRLTGASRGRLVLTFSVMAVLAIAAVSYSPEIEEPVTSRAETLTNLEGDASYEARKNVYLRGARNVARNPLGRGLGSIGTAAKLETGETISIDSGIISTFYQLGWIGGVLYIIGIIYTIYYILIKSQYDQQMIYTSSIFVGFLVIFIFVNMFAGVLGIMFWTSIGLFMAGDQYNENEDDNDEDSAT